MSRHNRAAFYSYLNIIKCIFCCMAVWLLHQVFLSKNTGYCSVVLILLCCFKGLRDLQIIVDASGAEEVAAGCGICRLVYKPTKDFLVSQIANDISYHIVSYHTMSYHRII